MAVLVLPVATVLAVFSFDILLLWTGNAKTAEVASPIVSVLVIGMAINALMAVPYALQLSHGWTSIGLRINTFLIIVLIPAIFFMTTRFGAVGAATVWVALNCVNMAIGVPLTHRRLLRGEIRRWFIEDIGPPTLVAVSTVVLGRWFINSPMRPVTAIVSLSCVLLVALVLATLVTAHMRTWVFIQLTKVKSI